MVPTIVLHCGKGPILRKKLKLVKLFAFKVGIITVTSTRGLLLTMSKFFIWLSSSKSSNILVLFFSQIMGMYFTSMVVLMRMNMPPEYRAIITSVLGDLQFNFYHRWFDVTFLVSATATLALLYLAHKREVETQDKSV